jgi:outer membrane protein assembly factor BamB
LRTIFVILHLVFVFSQNGAAVEVWPGWRGGELQGNRNGLPCSVSWGREKNVVWRTPLPGDGFSSPVVSEDSIYVTAVTKQHEWRSIVIVLKGVGFLLLLTFVVFGAGILVSFQNNLWKQTIFAAAFGLSICFVLFGEGLLGFGSLPNTPRIFLALLASAPCWVCCLGFRRNPGNRLWHVTLSGLWFVLSGVCGVILAVKFSAWRESLWTIPAGLAIGSSMLAGVLFHVAKAFENAGRHFPNEDRKDFEIEWRSPEGRYPLICKSLSVLFIVIAASLLASLLFLNPVEEQLTFDVYVPKIPAWLPLLMAVPGAIALLMRRQGVTIAGSLLVVSVSVMVIAPLGIIGLAERGLAHSAYLRHVLLSRQPTFAPVFGWWGTAIILGCFTALLFGRFRASETRVKGKMFRLSGALVAIWFLSVATGIVQPRKFSEALSVVSLNRATGDVRWVKPVADAPTEFNRLNSRATSTPAIWNERVYAYFGSQGLVCVDRRGKKLWARTDLPFESHYGAVSSPVICMDRVIIVSESAVERSTGAPSFVAAFDCAKGLLRWKQARPHAKNFGGNNRTPLVLPRMNRKLILVWGGETMTAYDVSTGTVQWDYSLPRAAIRGDLVASPVADDDQVYLPQIGEIVALRIDALGSDRDPLSWRRSIPGLDCSSPLVTKNLIFAVTDRGMTYCLDAKTGAVLWNRALRGTHYSSPVSAGDCVYFCGVDGLTTVLKCDRAGEVVAQNDLNERTMTSFAIADGMTFIRTQENLYCIGRTLPKTF